MISPLAYVDSAAKIGKNVTIQPFAFIEGNVEIGDDCIIMSGAKILHGTRMGKGNKVHHNAVLGAEPQDFHYTGENSMLIIGDNNDIRENVVVSRAKAFMSTPEGRRVVENLKNGQPADGLPLTPDQQNSLMAGLSSDPQMVERLNKLLK